MTDVLTAIDDALDTGVATDDDPLTRELQELALALRADTPEPTDEFSRVARPARGARLSRSAARRGRRCGASSCTRRRRSRWCS